MSYKKAIARIILYIIPVLIAGNVFAQTRLKIVSANDNAVLPYATVTNLTMQHAYSANSRGELQLNVNTGDTIRVSYVGYKQQEYICKKNDESATIALSKDILLLEPVLVVACKKFKEIKVKSPVKGYGLPAVAWSYGSLKGIYGILFKSSRPGILESFSFWLTKWNAPSSAIPAPFMISFYEVNDSDGFPLNPLPVEPVIYIPKELGKQTIELDSVRIPVPEKGIYICFSYIMDERYAWPQQTKWCFPECRDTVIIQYGVFIAGAHEETYTPVFYDYKNDKWAWSKVPQLGIRYEAVLKYCRD